MRKIWDETLEGAHAIARMLDAVAAIRVGRDAPDDRQST
jgi:hypothetical protein